MPFTLDLTVHPEHRPTTPRSYGYVRHPVYTSSILLVVRLAFSYLIQSSWLTVSTPLRIPGTAVLVWALWWSCWDRVGDKERQKLFKIEWETYAIEDSPTAI
jgi:hypothetical protein